LVVIPEGNLRLPLRLPLRLLVQSHKHPKGAN
jgi:hypothetical protein